MNIVKNIIYKSIFFSLFFIGINANSFSQEEATPKKKPGLDGGSINEQFDYLISKSNKYEDYRVVKLTWLNKMKGNVLDSIKTLRENILSLESKTEEQNSNINSLKSELKESNEKLEFAIKERDSFSFLGILISKGSYNIIVWSLVFGCAIGAVLLFLLYKRSHTVTRKIKQDLADKQEEFDAHRKWALEREQKLARELNKIKQKYKGLD